MEQVELGYQKQGNLKAKSLNVCDWFLLFLIIGYWLRVSPNPCAYYIPIPYFLLFLGSRKYIVLCELGNKCLMLVFLIFICDFSFVCRWFRSLQVPT